MLGSRRGAPRNEKARQAILNAVAALFQERGYQHLTIEGVAARAKVSKQTIYRWWPTKSDLVAECLLEGRLFPEQLNLPNTGDVRADLIDWVNQVFALMRDPSGGGIVTSLVAAATANAEIGKRLRESLGGPDSVIARLQRGVEAGQLADNAPVGEISEALVGALLLKAVSGGSTRSSDAENLVDAILPQARQP